jgi:hypothetical protein
MTHPDRNRLIEEMVARYRRVLEQRLPTGPQTLDEIEETVEEVSQQIERELERRLLEQQEGGNAPPANRTRCACGALARFRRHATCYVVTRHGEHLLRRRYDHCSHCRQGIVPLDAQLGLDARGVTTQVRVWATLLGAHLPFAQAAIALTQLTGVRLGSSTVERLTLAAGEALRAQDHQQAHQHRAGRLPQPTVPGGRPPRRLYVGMDGKMVPLRDPWKQDGTAGPLVCRWGECKTGVIYEAHATEQGDRRVRRRAYLATMGEARTFGRLLATVAHEQGVDQAQEVVVLGDGAPWIWGLAAALFPRARQVVDFFHVSEHLWAVANERFGVETQEARAWVAARQAELKADQVEAVLGAIQAWRPRTAERRTLRRNTLAYFASNRERMRYGSFSKAGYHIGSGVVEASCKHVVGARLDQAGMHWREDRADAVLALRGALLSSDPPDLRPYCAALN